MRRATVPPSRPAERRSPRRAPSGRPPPCVGRAGARSPREAPSPRPRTCNGPSSTRTRAAPPWVRGCGRRPAARVEAPGCAGMRRRSAGRPPPHRVPTRRRCPKEASQAFVRASHGGSGLPGQRLELVADAPGPRGLGGKDLERRFQRAFGRELGQVGPQPLLRLDLLGEEPPPRNPEHLGAREELVRRRSLAHAFAEEKDPGRRDRARHGSSPRVLEELPRGTRLHRLSRPKTASREPKRGVG